MGNTGQVGQDAADGPAAALFSLSHHGDDLALQFDRKLGMIGQP
jgi:hypothetical protein